MSSKCAADPSLPGHLDHSSLTKLLGYSLARASSSMANIFKNRISAVYQLNKLEFIILLLVMSNEGVTPKLLAVAMNIPGSNVTPLLDRLEQRQLLVRERSLSDKRVQHARLTEAGRIFALQMQESADSMEEDLLKYLSSAERAMLLELLRKLRSAC